MVPTDIKRYHRSINIPKRIVEDEITVPPWTIQFDSRPVSGDWTRCTHPEGALYFYHAKRRIYTEANLEDSSILAKIEKCTDVLYQTHPISNIQQNILDASDLVLEFWQDDECKVDDTICLYYFANHVSHTIFWLDDQDLHVDFQENTRWRGSTGSSLSTYRTIRLVDASLRLHMGYFPYGHQKPPKMIEDLKCKLVWLLTDELTSLNSLSQFNAEKLKQLISVTDLLEDLDNEYSVAIAGRLMNEFSWSHFLNYHGEYGARLNSNQSVHGEEVPRRTPPVALVYLLLFNAPVAHLKEIHNVYTDGIVKLVTWKKYLDELTSNWQEYVLYSTVLLNANVAFQAIGHVTPDDVSQSTVGQVASFISIIASTGGIIIGLLLLRQHRTNSQEDARDAHDKLLRYIHRTGGTERLAVLYSIPYAFLMWAMISFLVAIAWQCFNGGNRVTVVMCAVAFLLVFAVTLWCAYSGTRSIQLSRSIIARSWGYLTKSMRSLRSHATPLRRRRQESGMSLPSVGYSA
ncbi:hypothetical protein BDY19DRAFT_992525 [Irpex rosettiformis]|uniref:Uncharacterized protein n=1 Tax=Irpex rosettiformis TaxID=378272 RepID=A0ACB8U7G7_9APHY|nr:hypothetical protein BDY19DRAFT_992525 [Irpex rosettiformis]